MYAADFQRFAPYFDSIGLKPALQAFARYITLLPTTHQNERAHQAAVSILLLSAP